MTHGEGWGCLAGLVNSSVELHHQQLWWAFRVEASRGWVAGMALCKCMHCRKKVGVVLTSAPLANLVATCKIPQGVMGLPSWPPSSQRRECVQSWQPHTVSMARCCLPCSRQAAWQWSQLQNRNVSLYINNAFYLFQHMQSYRTWLHNCLPELSTNVPHQTRLSMQAQGAGLTKWEPPSKGGQEVGCL